MKGALGVYLIQDKNSFGTSGYTCYNGTGATFLQIIFKKLVLTNRDYVSDFQPKTY